MTQNLTLPQVGEVARIVNTRLNMSEFQTALFDVGKSYDNFNGTNLSAKIREAVDHARRMGYVQELLQAFVNVNPQLAKDLNNLSYINSDLTPNTVVEEKSDDVFEFTFDESRDAQKEKERKEAMDALLDPGTSSSVAIKQALFTLLKYM